MKHLHEETRPTYSAHAKCVHPPPRSSFPKERQPRSGLPDGQDETYPQTQPRSEPRHVRYDLHGRLRHAADERGDQRQLHRRNGVSRVAVMCGRCINIIANLWNTPRRGGVEDRRRRHRLIGGLHVGRRGGLAALARRRKAAGKPCDKPNLVMSAAYQIVGGSSASSGRSNCAPYPSTRSIRHSTSRRRSTSATRTRSVSCRSPA